MSMIQVPFGNALITRPTPLAGPGAYKTYTWLRPLSTHWRRGTCEEARCEAYQSGWTSTFDLSTELGQKQFHYCSHDKFRTFTYEHHAPLVTFTYPPGNTCFREHQVPLEREPVFVVRDGDFRGNPTGRRQALSADDWVDDFRNHEDSLADARQRG